MESKKKRKELLILEVLASASQALSSAEILDALADSGGDWSERTVRLYLQQLEDKGLVLSHGRQGRSISPSGRDLVAGGQLLHRVGSTAARIDRLTFGMSFDLAMRRGTVVINIAIVGREAFRSRLAEISQVFAKGYAMGSLVGLLLPGELAGDRPVPPGHVGFVTVCSVTLNGVLLKHGIPTRSLFSGLLQLEDGQPTRFVELINYEGSSIDPLQLFIRARMTDYLGAIRNGNGRIGAGFREIPGESHELTRDLARRLELVGLGAFLRIGQPSRELLNIPVRPGSSGVIVIGGLNPVAILEETGVPVEHVALSGLMEYTKLFPYTEMRDRL